MSMKIVSSVSEANTLVTGTLTSAAYKFFDDDDNEFSLVSYFLTSFP